jgi:hypothetical protein
MLAVNTFRSVMLTGAGLNLENAQEASRATLSGLLEINSTDPVEGMLSAQIIAAHEASMHLRQLAWLLVEVAERRCPQHPKPHGLETVVLSGRQARPLFSQPACTVPVRLISEARWR